MKIGKKRLVLPEHSKRNGRKVTGYDRGDPKIRALGIDDKTDLLRSVMANFIERYEKNHDFITAKNNAIPTKIDFHIANKPTPKKTTSSVDSEDEVRTLFKTIIKHLEEKGCKHTLRQILMEALTGY